MLDEIFSKSSFLKTHRYQDLIGKVNKSILNSLNTVAESRYPPAIVKVIQLDLCYIFFRHQSWIHAPVLMEITIDYLNSEFRVPNRIATQIVEDSIGILHAYFPTEEGWTAKEYNHEFLFQLFISCASSANEAQLRADIGFGDNVIKLLLSAANLDQSQKTDTVVFAPELTLSLNEMMNQISKEVRSTPWILDLFKLKSILESRELHNKRQFTRNYLESCFSIMTTIGWTGTTFENLLKILDENKLKKLLNQLISNEILFVQGAGKRVTYHLSHIGIDLLAEQAVAKLGQVSANDLVSLPGPVQIKVVEKVQSDILGFTRELLSKIHCLEPKAIFSLISRVVHENPGSIAELLSNLDYKRLNSWAKYELCRALSKATANSDVEPYLEKIARTDQSYRVRDRARHSLKELRRRATSKYESNDVIRYKQDSGDGAKSQ